LLFYRRIINWSIKIVKSFFALFFATWLGVKFKINTSIAWKIIKNKQMGRHGELLRK